MIRQRMKTIRQARSPSAMVGLWVFCLACAVCPDAAANDQDTDWDTLRSEANALYSSQEYAEALERFLPLAQSAHSEALRAEATLWKGHCHAALGNREDAAHAYEAAHAMGKDSLIGIHALESLASVYLSSGDYERAKATFEKAVATYPEIHDAQLASQGGMRYSRNRAALDSTVDYAVKHLTALASAFERGGLRREATHVYDGLALRYPHRAGSAVYTLGAADSLREMNRSAAALPLYLQLLSASGDRAYGDQAVIPSHNQAHLDAVARPMPLELVQAAVAGVNECLAEQDRLSEAELQQFSTQWHDALTATFRPFGQPWEHAWRQMAARYPRPPWASMARIALAECHVRDAHYSEAILVLDGFEGGSYRFPAVAQWRHHVLARARLGLGDFRDVAQHAGHLFGPDPIIASEAMLNMARAAEFSGHFGPARLLYLRAARESRVDWHRRQAAFAVERIASYKPYQVSGVPVFALPDDRTTRGEWFLGYGRYRFILCAQNFVVDRTGGSGPAPAYAARTSDPAEPSRLWVTSRQDDDPAALWDPVGRVHRPANRDDFGEQYPLGGGPDLLIDLEVPKGDYILSFYFVNDHNYYEPNREYTLTLETADETVAITDVRDFAGGVYKRFTVRGQLRLTARMWRNLSMNTLLSGIFLDEIRTLSPPPHPVGDPPSGIPRAVMERYEWMSRAVAVDPVRAVTYTDRLSELTEGLRRVALSRKDAGSTSTAWWMLSECYRLTGEARRGEAAFDECLAALTGVYQAQELLDAYEDIARAVLEHPTQGRPHLELLHRTNYKQGQHRSDRTWEAYLAALVADPRPPQQVEAVLARLIVNPDLHVTPRARLTAFRLIESVFPEMAAQADMLASAARAAKSEGDRARALELMRKALAVGPRNEAKASILFNLLLVQGSVGVPLQELMATYHELEPYGREQRYVSLVRTGLYELAHAHHRAKQYQDALALLAAYEEEYGADRRVEALMADCRRRLSD